MFVFRFRSKLFRPKFPCCSQKEGQWRRWRRRRRRFQDDRTFFFPPPSTSPSTTSLSRMSQTPRTPRPHPRRWWKVPWTLRKETGLRLHRSLLAIIIHGTLSLSLRRLESSYYIRIEFAFCIAYLVRRKTYVNQTRKAKAYYNAWSHSNVLRFCILHTYFPPLYL